MSVLTYSTVSALECIYLLPLLPLFPYILPGSLLSSRVKHIFGDNLHGPCLNKVRSFQRADEAVKFALHGATQELKVLVLGPVYLNSLSHTHTNNTSQKNYNVKKYR